LRLTADHVQRYAEISGDTNPLHFDEAFAAKTKFGRLVVQGGLTTGLLHALVAMEIPGPGTVFLSQNWKFTAPVFIGDTITAEAEISSPCPSSNLLWIAKYRQPNYSGHLGEKESRCVVRRTASSLKRVLTRTPSF
jgi:acyl dehydratase